MYNKHLLIMYGRKNKLPRSSSTLVKREIKVVANKSKFTVADHTDRQFLKTYECTGCKSMKSTSGMYIIHDCDVMYL